MTEIALEDIILENAMPPAEDFARIRNETDWGQIDAAEAQQILANSVCGITLRINNTVIGMARVIGDGVINIYVQDVILTEPQRRKGYGTLMMNELIAQLKANFPPSCSIGLMAAKGKTPFYSSFGFDIRPSNTTGAGMQSDLSQLHSRLVKTLSTA